MEDPLTCAKVSYSIADLVSGSPRLAPKACDSLRGKLAENEPDVNGNGDPSGVLNARVVSIE